MFGRNKEEKVDSGKVQEAANDVKTPGVRNLTVRQNGSVYEIHGQADDLRAKQSAFKTITDRVGVAAGVVNMIQIATERGEYKPAGMTPGTSTAPATASGRTHKVQKGETLSHLAQRYYGKASEYPKIFEANRDQLKDPDKIREGMTLRIP
jgi:nucleoid-associated protein YgaU